MCMNGDTTCGFTEASLILKNSAEIFGRRFLLPKSNKKLRKEVAKTVKNLKGLAGHAKALSWHISFT